jgi:heavy metal translocating P-type ATPase
VSLGARALPLRAALPPFATLLILAGGLALRAGPDVVWGERVLFWGLVLAGAPVVLRTLAGLLRGRFAADLVASLAIVAAIALRQPVAGLVVVLMQTGGEALEHYAAGRASRAVEQLEAAAPRRANRLAGSRVEEVAADQVAVGDRLLVRPGEMVPCDSEVVEGRSHVDESRLTGEPLPVTAQPGSRLLSGSLNLDGPLTVRALAPARESQYARIVELVRQAQASKSPLQRMADRAAVYFTPLTLAVCLLAYLASGEPIRVLAVLVVATPCPLILAAPVAFVGGINHAALHGLIVRHGEAMERLAQVTAVALDKTGTLTVGRPEVAAVLALSPFPEDEVLRLAAAVEEGSGHLLARSVIRAAAHRGLAWSGASEVREAPGQGVCGRVEGREVAVGSRAYITARYPAAAARFSALPHDGELRAWVAIDGQAAGTITFADQLRPETATLLQRLKALGLERVVLLTGDDEVTAHAVARQAGIQDVLASLLPADKVAAVEALERSGERVLMVGDGTNDAPALSRATVGVALVAHGGGVTAEAADVVVLADDPVQVAEAVVIGRRTRRIAWQSIGVGLGLSGAAMVVAALGHIPPTVGAVLQEAIDVAVIVNALRASAD